VQCAKYQRTLESRRFKGIVSRDGVSTEAIDVYSTSGLNIAPPISFILVNLSVKNIRRFKQTVSQCKMVGAGFHSIAKFRTQIFNPVLEQTEVCTPRIGTMKMAILLIAKVRSLNLRADCHRPELSTLFVLCLKSGVDNPQCIGMLFAEELLLLWPTADFERGS
jgi:hypothetical protein